MDLLLDNSSCTLAKTRGEVEQSTHYAFVLLVGTCDRAPIGVADDEFLVTVVGRIPANSPLSRHATDGDLEGYVFLSSPTSPEPKAWKLRESPVNLRAEASVLRLSGHLEAVAAAPEGIGDTAPLILELVGLTPVQSRTTLEQIKQRRHTDVVPSLAQWSQ